MTHKHYCPICKLYHICFAIAKHEEAMCECIDTKESFCNPCQNNRWDEIIIYLKNEDRI